jgi:hypothetical protein
MPQRNERLFWLYTEAVDQSLAAKIDRENQAFGKAHAAACIPCVSAAGVSRRLWLFRLPVTDQSVATRFNQQLSQHIGSLGASMGRPNLKVKRQTNLPQPLVCSRLGPWPITDVGLHSVNDSYNGMLVSFTYHEGRYYHIPHLQFSMMQAVAQRLQTAWQAVACQCHRSASDSCGVGCFDCFQLQCPDCDGTGWKGFSAWARRGYPVDYSSKLPIAV